MKYLKLFRIAEIDLTKAENLISNLNIEKEDFVLILRHLIETKRTDHNRFKIIKKILNSIDPKYLNLGKMIDIGLQESEYDTLPLMKELSGKVTHEIIFSNIYEQSFNYEMLSKKQINLYKYILEDRFKKEYTEQLEKDIFSEES